MNTLHRSDFIPNQDFTELDLLPNYERFSKIVCDGCGMPTRDAYSFGHPVPSHLGLAYVLLVETNPIPKLIVIFPDYALRISLGTFTILLGWLKIIDESVKPETRILFTGIAHFVRF